MDRRAFLALLTLASAAASSPALARQARVAYATGHMRSVSREKLMRTVYKVLRARDGAKVTTKALVHLGHNKEEAAQITKTARSIAHKSGSFANFQAVLQGNAPKRVQLSAQETAMFRSVARWGGGAWSPFRTVWDGDTWEGTGGNTWEGSSSRAGVGSGSSQLRAGNTWEGTGGNTWEGSGGNTWEGNSLRTGQGGRPVRRIAR